MTTHERDNQLTKMENLIVANRRCVFTAVSYLAVATLSVNTAFVKSLTLGAAAAVIFFVINAFFLAHTFFRKEDGFFRLMFGVLLLIMLLGFVGWLIMIIYNLDALRFTLTLVIVATLSSSANIRMKHKNAT